jgi:hypothetical protein
LSSFEGNEENHGIICNGTRNEFPQLGSNNDVRTIVVVRVEK